MKKMVLIFSIVFVTVLFTLPTRHDKIVENDAKYFKMISALSSGGCPVDGTRFSENMKNKKFVENVRKNLKSFGYSVPDSSKFFEKYFNKEF